MAFEWMDDLTARVRQISDAVPAEVNQYIKQRATEEFIKITGGAKGNQTADQIARGMYGQAPSTAAPGSSNPALFNSLGVSQLSASVGGVPMWALLALLVGGGIYLARR